MGIRNLWDEFRILSKTEARSHFKRTPYSKQIEKVEEKRRVVSSLQFLWMRIRWTCVYEELFWCVHKRGWEKWNKIWIHF